MKEQNIITLAEKATEGPWEAMDLNGRVDVVTTATPLKIVATVSGQVRENGMMFRSPDHGGADGAFIAALDPQTITSAMKVIEAARSGSGEALASALALWDEAANTAFSPSPAKEGSK